MRRIALLASFIFATRTAFADGWFDYPSSTLLKEMDPSITRLELKADLLLPPSTRALEVVWLGSDFSDGYAETLCTLAYAPASWHRRLPAATKLAVTSIDTFGDRKAHEDSRRAKVRVGLETAGGFQTTLECSYHYWWWNDGDPRGGSHDEQTPLTISSRFRVQRQESIIEGR